MRFIDVGCSGGVPTHWGSIEDLNVLGFDPISKEIEKLKDLNPHNIYINAFVGQQEPIYEESDYSIVDTQCYIATHVLSGETSSDLLEYTSKKSNPYNAQDSSEEWQSDPFITYYRDVFNSSNADEIDYSTLERVSLFDYINEEEISFIKVDTDGSELRVLESLKDKASSFSIIGIEAECQLRGGVDRDSSTFSNIDFFLRKNGFVLLELEPVRYSKVYYPIEFLTSEPAENRYGQVQFVNAVYVRSVDSILNIIKKEEDQKKYFCAYEKLAKVYGAKDILIEYTYKTKHVDNGKLYKEVSSKFNLEQKINMFKNDPKSFYINKNQNLLRNRVINRLIKELRKFTI